MDFVLYNEYSAVAFEVKSGERTYGRGMDAFLRKYPEGKVFSVSANSDVGSLAIPLEEVLIGNPLSYLG